jgi:hypothetical protein
VAGKQGEAAAEPTGGTEHAIRTDASLDDTQKAALLAVYQSMTRQQPAG